MFCLCVSEKHWHVSVLVGKCHVCLSVERNVTVVHQWKKVSSCVSEEKSKILVSQKEKEKCYVCVSVEKNAMFVCQ